MIKRSHEQWRSLFAEHAESGLSMRAFCQQRGLDAKYFSLRRRELNYAQVDGTNTPFIKATLPTPSVLPQVSSPIILHSPAGELHIPSHLPPEWLGAFLKSLG